MKTTYQRVLVKVSGEALMGNFSFGVDPTTLDRIARDLARAYQTVDEIALVVGGGNYFRGARMAQEGLERTAADHMGMLATVMNGLALRASLARAGVEARVLSSIPMEVICETYTRQRALHHLRNKRIVLCVGGLGIPFFTTDTASATRAAEMGCDLLMKATNVDGVYTADPKTSPDARRFRTLSHDEAIRRGYSVMDTSAFVLARDNKIDFAIFSIEREFAISHALQGKGPYTLVRHGEDVTYDDLDPPPGVKDTLERTQQA